MSTNLEHPATQLLNMEFSRQVGAMPYSRVHKLTDHTSVMGAAMFVCMFAEVGPCSVSATFCQASGCLGQGHTQANSMLFMRSLN